MLFQIVGVQFDQTRQQQIATAVDGLRQGRAPGIDRQDAAVADAQGTLDDFVAEHQPGIGENRLYHGHKTKK